MIAKTLAGRLKKVLPSSISSSQGAFVTHSQIMDQVIMRPLKITDKGKGNVQFLRLVLKSFSSHLGFFGQGY